MKKKGNRSTNYSLDLLLSYVVDSSLTVVIPKDIFEELVSTARERYENLKQDYEEVVKDHSKTSPWNFKNDLLKPFKGVGLNIFFLSLSLSSLSSLIGTIQNLLKF